MQRDEFFCFGGVRFGTNDPLPPELLDRIVRLLGCEIPPGWSELKMSRKVHFVGKMLRSPDVYRWCKALRKQVTGSGKREEVEFVDQWLQCSLKPMLPRETLWLHDESIRYALQREEFSSNGSFFFGGCLSVDRAFKWPPPGRWAKEKATCFGFAIGDSTHWTALFVRAEIPSLQTGSSDYFDSFGSAPTDKMLDFVSNVVNEVALLFPAINEDNYLDGHYSRTVQQKDGWHCGTYVIEFLVSRSRGETYEQVDARLRTADMNFIRAKHFEIRSDLRDPYNLLDGPITLNGHSRLFSRSLPPSRPSSFTPSSSFPSTRR